MVGVVSSTPRPGTTAALGVGAVPDGASGNSNISPLVNKGRAGDGDGYDGNECTLQGYSVHGTVRVVDFSRSIAEKIKRCDLGSIPQLYSMPSRAKARMLA